MNIRPNILIVSVFQKAVSAAKNIANHKEVLQALKDSGLSVLELQGKYDDTYELSILIEGFQYRQVVEKIAKSFNQECYLESHNDRATFLVFPDGSTKSIGTLTPVSKQEAEAVGSYSYSPVVDQYFVTR